MPQSRRETDPAYVARLARVVERHEKGIGRFPAEIDSTLHATVTMVLTKGSEGRSKSDQVLETEMTETLDRETLDQVRVGNPIDQALEIIDRSLGTLHQRELVSASEMSDILLDMRSLLAADAEPAKALQDAVN